MAELQMLYLTRKQVEALAEMSKNHTSPAHLYGTLSGSYITVEFEFPYRYVIEHDGTITASRPYLIPSRYV